MLDRVADESGLAIALIDGSSREVVVSNNNSICQNLNPNGKFEGKCADFCGTAFEETAVVGGGVGFTCHAGLECRAVPVGEGGQQLVAIVGRTFINAEDYRKATSRAISGDWSGYSPSEFFKNILLTGSVSVIEQTAKKVEALMPKASQMPEEKHIETPGTEEVPNVPDLTKPSSVEPKEAKPPKKLSNLAEYFNRQVGLEPRSAKTESDPAIESLREPKPEIISPALPVSVSEPEPNQEAEAAPGPNEKRAAEARAWRSFFGSLLKTDYASAANSILEFLALQYGFSALIWLEKKDNQLENATTFGEMKGRKVRLGIASDDKRLLEALQNEVPLELTERPKEGSPAAPRTMYLFPIGFGDDISAGIAVLDPISDDGVKKQLARICHSLAPQLEILRLRSDVARVEMVANAVRRFSESLKGIDADDLWLNLTQIAAEMLGAERASLLIYDKKAKALEIKAIVGAKSAPDEDEVVGDRVARIVFEKNRPIIVPDVSKTGLLPANADRQYKTPSFLSCPISIGTRAMGVMSFTDKASGKAFDRDSLRLFQAIAPQLAVAIDRASLKEKAGEFEQLSVTDPLTGLLNRRYIEERLMEEIKRSNRHGFPMSFVMLDVDSFKSYNDHFGHPAGDLALKMVGHVIRETLRGADVAARYGGEEFAILLPQTTNEEAATIAERIRRNIEGANFPHRPVTASIGIASCSADLCSAPNIVYAADKALYKAKHEGRNRVVSFEEMHRRPE